MKNKIPLAKSILSTAILATMTTAYAQDSEVSEEEVIVTGIRASLESALNEKRQSANLKEVIIADDIGKLPDQNLAEVLENITGIQITRSAGVGTNVQIRGDDANRVEINGVSTVGSGSGRNGIDFEDVNASIISAVEVIKSPEAKTIEGSVGGTINLRTIRPLELKDTLGSFRIQGEESSLSSESISPRLSGAFGDNWETDAGTFGFVISGSYTEQEAVSFRPRVDRDGSLVENNTIDFADGADEDAIERSAAQDFDFIGIQFLVQEQENDDYETKNLATTFEWAPNDEMKFYFDAVINRQERSRDNYRLQASGVSAGAILNSNLPTSFETINFGSLDGLQLGSMQAALTGTIQPNLAADNENPNLRFTSETGARVTDSEIFAIGGEWQNESWLAKVELSTSNSDTSNPTLNTQLNFINPNAATAGSGFTRNENATPFIYDLRGGSIAWGIDFDSPLAPTVADLTNPENVVLDQVDFSRDTQENSENAIRADFSYQIADSGFTSVDFGFRRNTSSSKSNEIGDRLFSSSTLSESPRGTEFAELLVAGPSNFASADGRELAIRNFLLIDPDRSFSDPNGVLAILDTALGTVGQSLNDSPEPDSLAFFDIEETTNALYVQVNFEEGIFSGNLGVRYVDTSIDSTGNSIDGDTISLVTSSGSYTNFLPRFNMVAAPRDDLQFRLGLGRDIRRPDFDDLNTSVSFDTNENAAVSIGNPSLQPEEVDSFDIAAEWYFAPSSVVSIGYFYKQRTNIIGAELDSAGLIAGLRETDPSCPLGGIYNPAVDPNLLGVPGTTGLCVDLQTQGNDPAVTTQQGVEFAVQYDLAEFEDQLGWASGFGVLANYTVQQFGGGSIVDESATRGTNIFNAINGIYDDDDPAYEVVQANRGLLDFSEDAYNITLYYEKYGLSARMRYTWRDAFRTLDFAGGASTNSTLGFPVVTHDRGQLNASVNYDVTDNLNIGVEAVNLTEEGITQSCVNEGAMLCFEGIPDRRVIFGASYKF